MASVTVSPASCLMALVTSSLVSRIATLGSTGTSQARIAAWTWLRASAAAAGPVVSRTRRECSSVGRVGALVFIGLLRGPVSAGPEERGSRCAALPGKIRAIAGYSAACMTNSAASCTLRHRSADGFRRTARSAATLGHSGRRGKAEESRAGPRLSSPSCACRRAPSLSALLRRHSCSITRPARRTTTP